MYKLLFMLSIIFSNQAFGNSYQFVFQGKEISLPAEVEEISPIGNRMILNKPYFVSDEVECYSKRLFFGGSLGSGENDYALYYLDDEVIKKIADIPYGKFIKVGDKCFALYIDNSRQHFSVSYLFSIAKKPGQGFEYREVFKLPGNLSSHVLVNGNLIIYGIVNERAFAVLVENDDWSELLFVEDVKRN